jgi:chromosomal replication initiation ATPase DnaA
MDKIYKTIAEIKSKINQSDKKEYAKSILYLDELFDKHSKIICPSFKNSESAKNLYNYFLALVTDQTKKGVYLYGNVGVGKSTIFKIYKNIGLQLYSEFGITKLLFSEVTAPWLVNEKMESVSPGYKGNFSLENYYKGKLYIDDLGIETKCFNSYELLEKILFQRHRNESLTFVSSNKTPREILERYGPQIFDRMGEMFHIIKWEGESLRS